MGRILSYKTESALKLTLIGKPVALWNTDLISSLLYERTFTTEALDVSTPTVLSDSLNINFSPATNCPVVWDTFISPATETSATYAIAPLLRPLTREPFGAKVFCKYANLIH